MKKLDNMLKSMAIGDHNGYQYENMNRDLVRKINPQFKKTVIKGKPLTDSTITDDTEHMILTYLALKTTVSKFMIKSDHWRNVCGILYKFCSNLYQSPL